MSSFFVCFITGFWNDKLNAAGRSSDISLELDFISLLEILVDADAALAIEIKV